MNKAVRIFSSLISVSFIRIFIVSGLISGFAFADDAAIQKGITEASLLYTQRSAVDSKPIDEMLTKLATLEGKAENADLNYRVLILEARALYWKGGHTSATEDKISIHALGQSKADQAKQLNSTYADGYYYAGTNLARWAEAKGVFASLSRKNELMQYMNNAMSRTTMPDTNGDSQPGDSIDGDGPYRVLGRIYFALPAIFGGSHTESVKALSKAYNDAKNVALNGVYYAETLYAGNSTEKSQAKQILDDLLLKDPTTYNSVRGPETLEEFELARKLRAKMN